MTLSWHQASVLGAFVLCCALLVQRRWPELTRWGFQFALISGLYSLWQIGLDEGVTSTEGAVRRGTDVFELERRLHLLGEGTLQRWVFDVPGLMRTLDTYYATVHFLAMGALLTWLYAVHRDRYPRAVGTLTLVTGAAMFIQFIPVAPPRLIPALGVVDAPHQLGQSVYDGNGLYDPGQLIAMPSVHMAWSLIIAVVAITVSASRWRWLVALHPLVTMVAVVASGNHYWMDGIVSAGLIALALTAQLLLRRVAGVRERVTSAPHQVPAFALNGGG